jgi:thioesterase domain-containing protein/aryl carrier-like protein
MPLGFARWSIPRPANCTGSSHIHDRRISQSPHAGPQGVSSISQGWCSVKAMPTSATVEMLTPIWQRVLQRSSIAVEDNFFDLGGDSSLALQLFNEIAHASGRELPPVMIYQAPTIVALASLLEQDTTPRFPPLILLKAGTAEPPVFITHGLGGSVMDFFQVVKHIRTPNPIHGMQAKGIDGTEEPFDRIEDMAQFCLDAIRQVQPHGPYLLAGYSLGGLVMLEVAQLLTADGEKVALLAMLDTYPDIRYLSLAQRARLVTRLATRRATTAVKLPVGQAFSLMIRPSRRRSLAPRVSYQPPVNVELSPAMQRARECAYLALTRYKPRFYAGKIRFVRAEIPTDFPADPRAVWGHLADEFEAETVPGDHLGIMSKHYEKLASAISRYVEEALR